MYMLYAYTSNTCIYIYTQKCGKLAVSNHHPVNQLAPFTRSVGRFANIWLLYGPY